MKWRAFITVAASAITGVGAALLATPQPASAAVEGWWCSFSGSCESHENWSCGYGQWDPVQETCNTGWPPPCPTCADDCCGSSKDQ